MKRGELWTLRDDNYASKARPVVIVQAEPEIAFNSVILCLFTTFDSSAISTRVKINPSEDNGLRKLSYVMTEKLLTIDKNDLGVKIGELDREQMHAISRQLARVLAIGKDDV
jgi:mRNA interferase MazF